MHEYRIFLIDENGNWPSSRFPKWPSSRFEGANGNC
jgi:hypothetical protein